MFLFLLFQLFSSHNNQLYKVVYTNDGSYTAAVFVKVAVLIINKNKMTSPWKGLRVIHADIARTRPTRTKTDIFSQLFYCIDR